MALQNPGHDKSFVNHGFRSTFKNWAKAKYTSALIEAQLHHKEPGKTNQAYGDDDDLLEERRPMMMEYDSYLNSTSAPAEEASAPAEEAGNGVALGKRRRTG